MAKDENVPKEKQFTKHNTTTVVRTRTKPEMISNAQK